MSEEPCKKFSDALNIVLFHLMHRSEPELLTPAAAIPNLISLIGGFDGGMLSYGVIGSSSQLMRRVSLNHYEFHLHIAFPFKLTPTSDGIQPGCVLLQADADVHHPAVVKGFLDRQALYKWLFQTIPRVFTVKCCNGEFTVTWSPVLEFEHSQWPLASSGLIANGLSLQALPWYAVPLATRPLDSRSFVVLAPDWERCIMDTHQHSRRLLRLFDVLAETYKVKFNDFNLVIRTIMLHEVNNLPRDLGNSMITFVEAVMARLKEGRQNLFLVESVNVLQSVEADKLEQNYEYLSKALMELKKLKMEAQNLAQRESKLENWSDNDIANYDSDEKSWMNALLKIFDCRTGNNCATIIFGPIL